MVNHPVGHGGSGGRLDADGLGAWGVLNGKLGGAEMADHNAIRGLRVPAAFNEKTPGGDEAGDLKLTRDAAIALLERGAGTEDSQREGGKTELRPGDQQNHRKNPDADRTE